ncbi:MAG: metallophosphoesterase [Gemmatimonadota bacterium]
MLTIVHGSDLHFGKPHAPRIGEHFLRAAHRLDPDIVVLSGDFTQRAKVTEFQAARDFLARLPDLPLVVTPGNHDVPLYRVVERILSPFRNYRTYIREDLNEVVRIPGLTVVSLNSAAPRTAIVNGRIRRAQVEFAREAFRSAPGGDVKAVVAHHHLAPAPDYEGDRPLPRGREILDDFEGMGVELVLGGHLHRAYIGNSLDVYPGKDREHGIVILQSGTTTSRRGRAREQAKNTFNVVRVVPGRLEITHYMYFSDAGRFAPFSVHAFPRAPNQWFEMEGRHGEVDLSSGRGDSDGSGGQGSGPGPEGRITSPEHEGRTMAPEHEGHAMAPDREDVP